jgi:ribosome-binding ATPase YchF (GTP1/OBG family)
VDIAGLVKGASEGAGLGNKFLSHIREVTVIAHVVRVFEDSDIVKEGSVAPLDDYKVVRTELELADLEKGGEIGKKPEIIVLNVSENQYNTETINKVTEEYSKLLEIPTHQIIVISAKIEAELAGLSPEDQVQYLKDLGLEKSGLERLIQKAYEELGLISFLTCGEKEVKAWTIKKGQNAVEAAGEIHTDFMKKFIKAEVVSYDDFIENGGWKGSRLAGKARLEGKDYIMQNGDVVEFKIGS